MRWISEYFEYSSLDSSLDSSPDVAGRRLGWLGGWGGGGKGGGKGRARGGRGKGGGAGWAAGGAMVAAGTSAGSSCEAPVTPAVCPRNAFGTSAKAAHHLRRFLDSPPRTWFWCYSSLAINPAHQKKSPGVLALTPGATLHARLDSRVTRAREPDLAQSPGLARSPQSPAPLATSAGDAPSPAAAVGTVTSPAGDTSAVVTVSIEHLVSYENMGVATVRCIGASALTPHTLTSLMRIWASPPSAA